jgi:hypothetical protein
MMNDGTSHEHLPDDSAWDHLGSTSQVMAETSEQLYRSMNLGRSALPVAPSLSSAEMLSAARRLWVARRVRDRIFGPDMFPDPAWNILLDLFIAGEEGRNVTIKSACVAGGVPQSTALRYIAHLIETRYAVRTQHPSDARSAYLRLTERGRARMAEYLSLTAAYPGEPGA